MQGICTKILFSSQPTKDFSINQLIKTEVSFITIYTQSIVQEFVETTVKRMIPPSIGEIIDHELQTTANIRTNISTDAWVACLPISTR
jgi:uncharacterized alpha-E superfamily protein